MQNLYISPSKTTPEINFDAEKNILTVSGESFPENSANFYEPVFKWLNEYLSKEPEFTFIFKLVYFNTSSSKAILDLMYILENYFKAKSKGNLVWFYDEDDEDIYDSGLEFTENLSIPTKLEPFKND